MFLFLWDLSIDATNWRAEQAIRPAVVIRKVCGGNRTRHGADTQQVLASVVRTARQRHLDLPPLIATMLRATRPRRPRRFRAPPATRLRPVTPRRPSVGEDWQRRNAASTATDPGGSRYAPGASVDQADKSRRRSGLLQPPKPVQPVFVEESPANRIPCVL